MKQPVPSSDAPWRELSEFALTYHGYMRCGGFEAAAAVAHGARDRWDADGVVPESLDDARLALFFEQRRWHHLGDKPGGQDEEYIRALVDRIARLSGGACEWTEMTS